MGMTIVLVLLVTVGLGGALLTRQVTAQVTAEVDRNDVLQDLRHRVDQEISLQREYYLQPDDARRQFQARTDAVRTALLQAGRTGSPADEPTFTQLETLQARFVTVTRWFFSTLDKGQLQIGVSIDNLEIEPLFRSMDQLISDASDATTRQLTASMRTQTRSEQFVRTATIVTFAPGLLLLVVFGFLFRFYQRHIDAIARSEIEHLQQRALTDNLTGLGNHRAYLEELEAQFAAAQRRGEVLVLAVIDVDGFKQINDRHGHGHGDHVLAELGTLLRSGRAEDRAFRIGGDEFALIMAMSGDLGAVAALNHLRAAAERQLLGATLSVGIATVAQGKGDIASLREQADAALYEAKRRGRNIVVTFAEIQETAGIFTTAKVHAVLRLLDERRMRVAFQPIWQLESGSLLGYEALARPGEDYGLAGPQEAFDVAEHVGRGPELDALCRESVLLRAHELPAGVLLFINLSPQSLEHPAFTGESFARAVRAAGLSPERVVLEITERCLARPAVVRRETKRLRELGFNIALDDMGVGYTGLDMLRMVPVDYLKVDREIVAGALVDTTARSVLAAILAFALEAGTFVIAEGIENEAMLDFLCQAARESPDRQVHAVQGYLLGRPSFELATASTLMMVPRQQRVASPAHFHLRQQSRAQAARQT